MTNDEINKLFSDDRYRIKGRANEKRAVVEDLHVYSAGCSWHGPISEVGKTKGEISLPCCPYCGSVLFQTGEQEWWDGAKKHQEAGHTNYETFLRWTMTKKRCWPSLKEAAKAYSLESSRPVILNLADGPV